MVDAGVLSRPLVAIPALFGAGVLTSLTPCVYPMVPITAGILGGSGAAQRSRLETLRHTLLYVTGLSLVYATLGLIAGLTGSLFGTISSNPWAYFIFGNLLLIAALAMLEVIPVAAPARLLAWASRLGGDSSAGVFLMGATSGLVAAPCGAPAFAAVLTWVGTTQSGVLGFLYLFVFSLGMTAVLVAVGLSAGFLSGLPKAGRWTRWAKTFAGVVMLAMAEYYFVKMGSVL